MTTTTFTKTINLPSEVAEQIAKYNDQTQEIEMLKVENAKMKEKWATGNDTLLKLGNNHSSSFMRVEIDGESLFLTLIPRVRNNGNVPNWTFSPVLEGFHPHMQHFDSYGLYDIAIGGGVAAHNLLIHFDSNGARFTVYDNEEEADFFDGILSIEEFTKPATFTLECKEDEQE